MTSTLPPLVQAFSGAIGSATANAIVYPLDLVATRLQTSSSKRLRGYIGVLRALRHVLKTEGWRGMYDGLTTDTAATIVSNFLYFYFYAFLRTILLRRKTRITPPSTGKLKAAPALLSVAEELGIGFLAGVTSRAISTPLSVITVRLQTETEGEDDGGELDPEKGDPEDASRRGEPRGVLATVNRIYAEQGLQGFWGGFTTTIPLSLNPAITLFLFQLYGKIATRGNKGSALGTPSASSSFVGAAFSNSIATWLLYPLMLAKTRLQMHRKRAKEASERGEQAKCKQDVSMLTIWEDALDNEGPSGLYQGLKAQLLKGFVSQGVTMMVKQRVELYVVALYLSRMR
ncbi:mitochondrial carrier [Phanerochaete sordida]|uniref:Mitochondrial carrier n=1 Tax=Phanerochaete sordida TaxID=48140 RepID=A0A9P3GJB6_9APHY|nr:mitochondrial carrier [Phanerochaete sordida]